MFNLNALFNRKSDLQLKDAIAELLKVQPEKLEEFEAAYKQAALSEDNISDNFFDVNSRQASAISHSRPIPENIDEDTLKALITRAVDELSSETPVLAISDGKVSQITLPSLPDGTPEITNDDIKALPENLRPQATGHLMKVDINDMSYLHVLQFYINARDARDEKLRRNMYGMFRQGLDILDLDPVLYAMLGQNPNSMSHWLPQITSAATKYGFFKIPKTRIAKVPMPILQLSRIEYTSLTPTTLKIVDDWAMKAFDLDVNKTYFIKTGTYSSKFDFRNAKVTGEKEVRELGEYLLYIQHQASMMAGPLSTPCIYGVSTTNEWVVREYIEDKENNPCIYKGLPLHTEYRVFVDFDTDEVLGISPYWEPTMMKHRFSQEDDASSPHQRHDYIIYKMHEETLMGRYNDHKDEIIHHIKEMLPDVALTGQWSIDIMQNGDDFWLIDMATADTSALRECVPNNLLKKTPENWIPANLSE